MKLGDMPAFPKESQGVPGSQSFAQGGPGMTYRQWLAGMAMQSMLRLTGPGRLTTETAAKFSIEAADALIAELEKQT